MQNTVVPAQIVGNLSNQNIGLSRSVLEYLLNNGFHEIAVCESNFPILATNEYGKYVTMPIRLSNVEPIATTNNIEENPQMEENKTVVESIQTPAVTLSPLDELNNNVEELRNKLKTLFDESSVLIRKVKDVSFAQKQKEREFVQGISNN